MNKQKFMNKQKKSYCKEYYPKINKFIYYIPEGDIFNIYDKNQQKKFIYYIEKFAGNKAKLYLLNLLNQNKDKRTIFSLLKKYPSFHNYPNIKATCYLEINCKKTPNINLEPRQIHGVNFDKIDGDFIFSIYDGKTLPYSDQSFDLIHFSGSNLEIIPEIYRVARYNAYVVLKEYNAVNNIAIEACKALGVNGIFSHEKWGKIFYEMGFIKKQFKSNYLVFQKPSPNTVMSKIEKRVISRTLSQNLLREKYKRSTTIFKNLLHWGQRKLLLTEIEFLTLFYQATNSSKKIYFIYAGAAAGTHLVYLSKIFPEVYFELYDPREFDRKLDDIKKINTHVQYFTDKTAQQWKSEDHPDKIILLVSDIRTGVPLKMSDEEVEERVKIDHEWQYNWYKIMKPYMTMFKFRLPWDDGFTEYPEGKIYIQPYPPATSTETRLIICGDVKNIRYDNRKYEEQMYYFNKYERNLEYENILETIPSEKKGGLKNNYDSVSEIQILTEYLNLFGEINSENIINMSKEITSSISDYRTLITQQPIKEYRKNMITRLKKEGVVPNNAPLTKKTFDIYVLPIYNQLEECGMI